ncbi:MAG: nickel pincer cofactor biosynthesis protein LarC [Actinomycetota bacterium]|nr:nickel pincer cofactor biosynthesis protein LarC [Actinomycetota bacterium]
MTVTRLAWWHCFAGIAGDMALGSLVDAGADLTLIERELVGLPIGGWSLEAEPVLRGGLACTRLHVRVKETSVIRTHAHIVGLVTEARLPERARRRALDAFARLAEVEGRLHHRPPSQVHFHEVGGMDAIIDIVGTCVALEVLGVDRVACSAVAQGTGVIRSAHGLLPNPVPAVVGLLADAGAPTYGTDRPVELTTPTGAALLATLVDQWGPMPALTLEASGFGAGTRELDGVPNAVQVVIGSVAGSDLDGGQPIAVMETNVDDVTGEVLAHTVARLVAAGAYDAWITPVIGKKGRPAHVVSVVCDPARAGELRTILVTETGTLGVRTQHLQRWVAARGSHEVLVEGHPIRVKRGPSRVKAEHDDVARVAQLIDLPVREVARRAEGEAGHRPPDDR